MKLYKFAAVLAALSAAPAMASAAPILLDFGNVSAPSFPTAGLIQYSDVASGINATLTAHSTFNSSVPANNGSASGDIRVNLNGQQTVEMTLSLFNSTIGNGFSSLYDPGVDYDWQLGFYDIDGFTPNGVYYDVVGVSAAANSNLTYTLTTSTDLVVTTEPGSVTFSAEGAPAVAGQEGLSGTLTQAQSDVAALINITNTPTITFSYSVIGRTNQQRNLLVDGGGISLAGPTVTNPIPSPVPLPGAGILLLGALGALGALRHARKA